jgi:uncharacterized sporulation protein YeaH/YhbH (DUF444 family)
MLRSLLILLAAFTLIAADDPWVAVQKLKSRSELRIYKKGSREPLIATFDEANNERILIVVKNEQMAIPKDDIDRVDARPPAKSDRKVTKESSVKTTDPDYTPRPPGGAQVPGESYSTGLSVGSSGRPDFQTVYRRPSPH